MVARDVAEDIFKKFRCRVNKRKMATNRAFVLGVALSVFAVLTIRDLFPSKAATEVQGQNTFSSLNSQKKYAGPAIKFLFW